MKTATSSHMPFSFVQSSQLKVIAPDNHNKNFSFARNEKFNLASASFTRYNEENCEQCVFFKESLYFYTPLIYIRRPEK